MASPHALDGGPIQHEDNWGPSDEQAMTPRGNTEPSNGAPLSAGDHRAGQDPENTDYTRGSTADAASVSGSKADTAYREKQVKVLRSFPV
jgi:hypothetical protein